MRIRGFASDNNAGVCPEVLAKLAAVNSGHVVGYGGDRYTAEAIAILNANFGSNANPFLVFTGTAANVLSIASALKPFQSVICAETAHIQVDECGAPERFTGCKLIPIATPDGKLNREILEKHLTGFGFEHHAQPGLVSISQPTEVGTVYSLDELKTLSGYIHSLGLKLHMDGARLANAVVSLNCSFKECTADAGVDILSFGGTKNGLMAAESVIVFSAKPNDDFKYIRKQAMQLSSKMRYVSAQFIAYFENDLWKKNALHANGMAQKLFLAVKDLKGVEVSQKVEANGVFACIPEEIIEALREEYFFYNWDESRSEVRWMTSWDTTEEDIEGFVKTLTGLLIKRKIGV